MLRNEWLEERKKGIGGSDASVIMGLNPYKTTVDLWKEKTGRIVAEDISAKEYVKYGTLAEAYLRELFKLDFPKYNVKHEENTIIKHPKCKVNELEGLTTKIAEVIVEAIYELYGIKLEIKIPNDLLLNGKKICGILTEIHTMSEKIEYMLISFGFNVNEEDFNPEIEKIATSLKKEFKKEFNREEIIIQIIKKINNLI